jgi:hypothetical protein
MDVEEAPKPGHTTTSQSPLKLSSTSLHGFLR